MGAVLEGHKLMARGCDELYRGPAVLMMTPLALECRADQATAVAAGAEVVQFAVDIPNAGRSPRGSGDIRVQVKGKQYARGRGSCVNFIPTRSC